MPRLSKTMMMTARLMTMWRRPATRPHYTELDALHQLLIDDALLQPDGEELRPHLDALGYDRIMATRGQTPYVRGRLLTVEEVAALNWVSSWDVVMAFRSELGLDRTQRRAAMLRLVWQLGLYAESVEWLTPKDPGFEPAHRGTLIYPPGTYPGLEAYRTKAARRRRAQEILSGIVCLIRQLKADGVEDPSAFDWRSMPPEPPKKQEEAKAPEPNAEALAAELEAEKRPTLTVVASPIQTGKGFDATDVKRWKALEKPTPLAMLPNPVSVETALIAEFPYMRPPIDRIGDDLRLAQATGLRSLRLRPLLLVGPPGVGKSRFGRRLAEVCGVPFTMIGAGGSGDNRSIAGTSRGWGSAEPSRILGVMLEHGVANPLIMVDEIDKAATSRHNGRLVDTLLGMLERETAVRFNDECLGAACDVSWVSWILTANQLESVPAPLLDRLSVVEVGQPTIDHFPSILEGMLADLAKEWRTERWMLPELEPETVEFLAEAFAAGHSIRRIRSAVISALAASARHAPRH